MEKNNNYAQILQHIYNPSEVVENEPKADFIFIVNNQIVYTLLADFESKEAKDLYIKANECRKQIEEIEAQLSGLREQYVNQKGNKETLSREIKKLESSLVSLYGQPEDLDNRSRAAEINVLLKQQKK